MSNVKPVNGSAEAFFEATDPALPALKYAQALQQRCRDVGFDWHETQPVLDKIKEEVDEVQQELDASPVDKGRLREEIGDALFAIVNLARHMDIDADHALREASEKFRHRFEHVVALANEECRALGDYDLASLEAFWVKAKAAELAKQRSR